MSIPNYRVLLSFDSERKVFTARAPELEHCSAEGATRGEAIARLEGEIEAQLKNMQERGQRPPQAVDDHGYTGEISVRVSRNLHKDLSWLARSEGVDLDHLLGEMLAGAFEARRSAGRRTRPPQQEHHHDSAGNLREREPIERERGKGYGPRYHGIMEDRANFIEYVRGLESETGGRPGNGRGPQQRGDRGEGRNQRRRRGRGGSQMWGQGQGERPQKGPPEGARGPGSSGQSDPSSGGGL